MTGMWDSEHEEMQHVDVVRVSVWAAMAFIAIAEIVGGAAAV